MPLTYWVQISSVVLLAAVAGFSLAAARSIRTDNAAHRAGWEVTGTMFTIFSADLLLVNIWGGLAIRAGYESSIMAGFLKWVPLFNHSRTFLAVGALVALVLLALGRGPAPGPRFQQLALALMLSGLAFGAALGMIEGPFEVARHFFAVVKWDVVELLVLLSALLVLLASNQADRLLWALYAAYACSLALGIFWLSLLTHLDTWWHPPVWTTHAVRNVFYALMVAAAAARLGAARQRRDVYGMLGRPVTHLPTFH